MKKTPFTYQGDFAGQKSPENNYRFSAAIQFAIILFSVISPFGVLAQAPTISYTSPRTLFAGSTITPVTPTSSGVAAPSYSGTPLLLGTGFNKPYGVAVDAAGNIYVADTYNSLVKEIPAGGGTATSVGS